MYLSRFPSVGKPASWGEFEDCEILDLFQLLTKSISKCRCFKYFPSDVYIIWFHSKVRCNYSLSVETVNQQEAKY
jgi:hypothetical protein